MQAAKDAMGYMSSTLYTRIARKKAEKAECLIVRKSRANLRSDAELGDEEQVLPGSKDNTGSECSRRGRVVLVYA